MRLFARTTSRLLFAVDLATIVLQLGDAFVNKLDKPVHTYTFVVELKTTMMTTRETDGVTPVFFKDGKFHKRDPNANSDCNKAEETDYTAGELNIADGQYHEIITVNGKMPAPTILAEHGQIVTVHVTNKYLHPITIHWHGLDQKDNFYFDGVSGVTQCPIMPGTTFTYKIKTDDSPGTGGTYWYHLHGNIMHEGVFGAFIIQEKQTNQKQNEFVALLSDWFPHSMEELYVRERDGTLKYQDIQHQEKCYKFSRDATGQQVTVMRFHALLVNGRGWYAKTTNSDRLKQNINSFINKKLSDKDGYQASWDFKQEYLESNKHELPIEKFYLKAFTSSYDEKTHAHPKFRLINAGVAYSIVFGVSGHKLRLTASDGYPLKTGMWTKDVDFVYVHAGERYDVELIPIIKTAKPEEFCDRSYEIHISTAEETAKNTDEKPSLYRHYGLALLVYRQDEKPVATKAATHLSAIEDFKARCTESSNCHVVNCPFWTYPERIYRTCTHLWALEGLAKDTHKILGANAELKAKPQFINIVRNGSNKKGFGHLLNGIANLTPKYPPFIDIAVSGKLDQSVVACGDAKPEKDDIPKHCTHILDVKKDAVLEYTLYSRKTTNKKLVSMGHPMHLHGHHFYVMRQGWPRYGQNGMVIMDEKQKNLDEMTPEERKAAFNDAEASNPLFKDTVWVPYGGYVVIRFKADNPGWWMFHCHLLQHLADGMSLIFRVGSEDPPIPADFPICGSHLTAGRLAEKSLLKLKA